MNEPVSAADLSYDELDSMNALDLFLRVDSGAITEDGWEDSGDPDYSRKKGLLDTKVSDGRLVHAVSADHLVSRLAAGTVGTASAARKVVLVTAASVTPRKVYWLWKPRVPRGALTLLAGMPGTGKSQVSLDFAAQVTRGEAETQGGKPRAVLVYATEDAREQVIVPRLVAAGADLSLVHFVTVTEADAKGVVSGSSLVLPIDGRILEEAIVSVDALLVVFDPLMSVMDPAKSAHVDRELRTSLEPLAAVLEKTGCAGIGLMHFRKAGGAVVDRVMGGRAFVGVARSVLVTVPDYEADEVVLSLEKSNYGALGTPGLRYRIATKAVSVVDDDGAWEDQETPYVQWLGETDGSGSETVRGLLDESTDSKSAKSKAADWLLMFLLRHGGSEWSDVIKDEAEKVGISESALHRGRKAADVLVGRTEEFRSRSYWYLDGSDHEPASVAADGAEEAEQAPVTETDDGDGSSEKREDQ